MSNAEVYQAVTDRMIAALKMGTVPWRQPWTAASGGRPMRMNNGDPYLGINVLLLGLTSLERGYNSPWWGSYDEIARRSGMVKRTRPRGGSYWVSPDGSSRGVRKGETGTKIVFAKTVIKKERDPQTGDVTERPVYLLHMWTVFNAEQADRLPARYFPGKDGEPVQEIRDAQEVIDRFRANGGPALLLMPGNRADYSWATDVITMPARSQFRTSEGYYATLFHELTHSTGHKDRLDREASDFSHDRKWGDAIYAREELVAEMGSAMLQAETGMATDQQFDQSAAYIADWLTALEKDSQLVPRAASQASKAVDLITGAQRQAEREEVSDAA